MRTIGHALVALAVCLGTAFPAAAQVRLETTSGRTHDGEIVSSDETSVEFRTTSGTTMRLQFERLTPMSQYRVRSAALDATDAAAELALADWCVDVVLYPQARRHYRNALEADGAMYDTVNEHMTAARKQASEEVLARAKDLEAQGREKDARALLTQLVTELPLEPASQEAAKLLAEDTMRRKEAAMTPPDEPSTAEEGDTGKHGFSNETRELFGDVVDHYNKMLDLIQAGLVNSNQSSAIREWGNAVSEGERALREADKLQDKADGQNEVGRALELVDSKVAEASVDAWIHMIDSYIFRGSEKQANDVVQEGLARYPGNQRLLDARQRVAMSGPNWGGWVPQRASGGGGRRR